ncbi:hypothetical protein QFZ82_006925 [Streptomyces sp. V4I23]|nr:hypothetical protein [Streptomyces sp. V4I23]
MNDQRVDEITGERWRVSSAIPPPWCGKSPHVSEVLPLLYLHGLSSRDFSRRWSTSSAARPDSRRRP